MSNTTEAMRAAKLEAAIRKVHAAKGRHHAQIANCEMFELVGLPCYRPGETPAAPAVTDSTHTGAVRAWDEDDLYAIERAADLLEKYRDFIRADVTSADIERHPYLPEIETTAEALRVLTAQSSPERKDCKTTGALPDLSQARLAGLIGNYFSEDWAQKNAADLLTDYRSELLAAQPSPERSGCKPVAPDAADLATHSWPIHEGGMRLGVPNGVLLVHKPTGIGVAVTRHRSQHQNRDEARTRLFAMLAAPPSPAERHYCERCGKRLGHTEGVHTCTPPEGGA